MCMICIEFEKQRLTIQEARRNLGEMQTQLDPEHVAEVERMLNEAEEAEASG